MAFSVKQWFDRFGSGGSYDQPTDTGDVPDTPLDAAGQRDQETRLSAYTDSTLAAHTGAATAAHAASAVSFSPTGSVGSTNAQAAIAEVASEAGSALTTGLAGKADLSGGHVPLAQLGSGTAASGKYVDGASGAWLPLPAQSGSTQVYVQESDPGALAFAYVWYKPSTEATTYYAPGTAAPVFTVNPAISGSALVGATLTCDGGTVTGTPTPTKTYQWKRAGTNISGETASTYVLVSGDVAAAITCTVTATNNQGSASASSGSITPAIPANSVAPAVTGSAVTGQTLTCSTGTWSGSPTYAYVWKRAGSAISGATASTYVLQVADEGLAIKCTVTATNANGSASADSNAVTPSASPTAPGQVTGLGATAGDAQVALAWTAPASNGGSAITTYLVEYRTPAGSGSYTTFSHSASTTPSITVTGLTNASQYEFRVSAVNAIGTGTASATATATPVSSVQNPSAIFGSDLYAWHRGSDVVGSDGASLASWPDTSGHSRDLAQGTAANRPVLKTAIVNGKAVVRFDAVNDSIAATYGTPLAQPWAVLAVLKVASQPSGIVQLWDGGSATVALSPEGDGSLSVDFSAGSHIFDSHDTGMLAWHAYAFIGNGTSSDINKDGTSVAASHDTGAAALSQMILNDYVGGGYATGMDVAEWVVVKRVPTGGDLTAWHAYCQAQYGTP